MDYLQIYKEEYNTSLVRTRAELIENFKLAKTNKRNFLTTYNKMNEVLYNKGNSMLVEFTDENLNSCYNLFVNRRREYDKNLSEDEVISLVFENEIKNEIAKLGKLDYEAVIKKLANHRATSLIQLHFSNNSKYYELVFEQEKFDLFFKKGFENIDFETSEEYAEMHKIEYPERLIVSKTAESNNNNTNKSKKTDTSMTNDVLNKEDKKIKANIINFSNKEKHVLLAVLLDSVGTNSQNDETESEQLYGKLPISEYLRLLAITKDIINYEPFYKAVNSISVYQELKKNTNLVKRSDVDTFLSELNNKLEELKINKFQKFLHKFLKRK
jgi:hypothetical protein